MKLYYKKYVALITIFIELSIIYSYYYCYDTWNIYDKLFSIFVLLCHIPFYYTLISDDHSLLNLLHCSIFVSLLFGFFVENIYILGIIFIFVIGLQIQWFTLNKCILNTDYQNKHFNFGFSIVTNFLTLLYSYYLFHKINIILKTKYPSINFNLLQNITLIIIYSLTYQNFKKIFIVNPLII